MKRDRSIPEVKITDAAFQFFFQMAGLVDTEHRARSAVDLAKAEVTAGELGWSWSWEYDAESWDPGDTDYKPREVLGCVLKNSHGQVLASLWGIADPGGIADPDRNFVRLTEAKLAREALTDLRTTISHHKALKAKVLKLDRALR
jgi:hypothetical protein